MNYFKYVINGRFYFVNFRHHMTSKPRTKCYLYDYDLETVHVGVAKLNVAEGDTYDEKLGESLAFERALAKRDASIEKMKVSFINLLEDQKERDKASLVTKFKREQDKYDNIVIEKEKPSILAFRSKEPGE